MQILQLSGTKYCLTDRVGLCLENIELLPNLSISEELRSIQVLNLRLSTSNEIYNYGYSTKTRPSPTRVTNTHLETDKTDEHAQKESW